MRRWITSRLRCRIPDGSHHGGSIVLDLPTPKCGNASTTRYSRLTLRVNHLKTNVEQLSVALAEHGVEVTPARYAPDGLIVTAGNPLRTPLANTGHFFIQDEASQLVSARWQLPKPGRPHPRRVRLAWRQDHRDGSPPLIDRAHIVAADVRGARMQLLRETVAASGARSVRLLQANLEAGLPFCDAFDVVFVDAPCSGLGTLRRDPDIRWRRREEDLPRFRTSQITMLRNAAAAVKLRWAVDLFDLLERAGGERRGGGGIFGEGRHF